MFIMNFPILYPLHHSLVLSLVHSLSLSKLGSLHKLIMACRHIFAVVLLLTIFSVLLGQFTSITPEFDRSTVTLFIGKEISAPPTFNCKSKPSKCTPCELNLKLHALLRLIKLGQFCLCILLSGDIAVNPGPNNLQPPAGFRAGLFKAGLR